MIRIFAKGISTKVNVTARLEFELAYFEAMAAVMKVKIENNGEYMVVGCKEDFRNNLNIHIYQNVFYIEKISLPLFCF